MRKVFSYNLYFGQGIELLEIMTIMLEANRQDRIMKIHWEGFRNHGRLRKPIRFAVRSLGWTEIAEEDLTAERSSRAVNRAIVDLSTGRNDVMDNVSKWGDGRELIMELDDNELSLIDPDTMTVVHSEKIQQIRVWGVGRDNGSSQNFRCYIYVSKHFDWWYSVLWCWDLFA
ncbi:phosphotyrosine interaction domain protein [Teladorsagia circumcincta]|uniref:Phosphotyrosine interaction domain protein n=1 Tax=Teladorsagia circumcincta TaxID=45464 RepID=A0A2G9V2D2_TELCI|nr:phosphotyrosine interaction domain protein [Teladorsagia circumcincta]